jgi:TatD DNase family protein
MNYSFTDTHTHLYVKEFSGDLPALMQKALANQVKRFYLPNIDSSSIEEMLAVEAAWPEQCLPMMGLHPCSVDEQVDRELAIVRSWLERRPFAGIGEIGLDLYWDKTHFEAQKKALNQQLDWALEFDYGVSIHCRSAFDELYTLLKSRSALPRSVFHCFSGTVEQAEQIIALGNFKLGIGGVLTFKNGGLEPVVRELDLSNFVLETDAPYLAPVPWRGKRNEPVYLLEIARKMAEIKGCGIDEIGRITTENAENIYQKR